MKRPVVTLATALLTSTVIAVPVVASQADTTKNFTPSEKKSGEVTGTIHISDELGTKVKQIISTNKVEPAKVDFSVDVGVAVPSSVPLHPLPPRVVELVPAYEGLKYFMLPEGRIVIVQPDTLKVVSVLS